jgi:radical SAM superfamily enzyme
MVVKKKEFNGIAVKIVLLFLKNMDDKQYHHSANKAHDVDDYIKFIVHILTALQKFEK